MSQPSYGEAEDCSPLLIVLRTLSIGGRTACFAAEFVSGHMRCSSRNSRRGLQQLTGGGPTDLPPPDQVARLSPRPAKPAVSSRRG